MDNVRPPWRLANCLRFVTAGLTATGNEERGKTIKQNDRGVCLIGNDDLGEIVKALGQECQGAKLPRVRWARVKEPRARLACCES